MFHYIVYALYRTRILIVPNLYYRVYFFISEIFTHVKHPTSDIATMRRSRVWRHPYVKLLVAISSSAMHFSQKIIRTRTQ